MHETELSVDLQIAQLVPCTEAEGPGKRFAIWFQGCPLRCAGCCNPEMLPFSGGTRFSQELIFEQILQAKEESHIEGITLLGGEPFAHATGASQLAEKVHKSQLSVMVFTGYTLEYLKSQADDAVQHLLQEIDVLIDGPYLGDQPEPAMADGGRRWIGSRNQRIHFFTEQYQETDFKGTEKNTLEIRFQNGEILVNGFPVDSLLESPMERN